MSKTRETKIKAAGFSYSISILHDSGDITEITEEIQRVNEDTSINDLITKVVSAVEKKEIRPQKAAVGLEIDIKNFWGDNFPYEKK